MGYKVLILEDNKVDAQLMKDYLLRSGESFEEIKLVYDKETYEDTLQTAELDLILSDYRLVDFDGIDAIRLKNIHCKEIPLIIVSGTIGEEKAVEVIKEGAIDFLIKNNTEKRLAQISIRAIKESNERRRRKEAEQFLKREKEFIDEVINSLPGLFYMVDEANNFVRVNQNFLDVLGYSIEELENLNPFDLYLKEDHKRVKKAIDRAYSVGNLTLVSQLKTKGGELPYYYLTGSLFHEDGKNFILGTGIDITDRIRAEEMIRKSLDEKEILLMEIHHRVKNNLALISGIMELQASKSENDVVINHLTSSQNRIKSIAIVHELLYESSNFSKIKLDEDLKQLIKHISSTFDQETQIDWQMDLHPIEVNVNQAIPCALIVNEVLTNIFKHAFVNRKKGNIKVSLKEEGKKAVINIVDDGVGLPDNFNSNNSDNLGLILIKTLSSQLRADFEYKTENEETRFNLTFNKVESHGGASHFLK